MADVFVPLCVSIPLSTPTPTDVKAHAFLPDAFVVSAVVPFLVVLLLLMSVVFQIVEAIVSAVDIVEASHKLNRCTQRLRLLHVDESVFEQTLLDTEPEVRPGPRALGVRSG